MAFRLVTKASKLWLQFPWRFLHFLLALWWLAVGIVAALKSYVVSTGLLTKYRTLDFSNLRYLAVVVESEEARDISKVIKLLSWLAEIGVKHVSLYDMDGVLKNSKEMIMEKTNATVWEEATSGHNKRGLTLEFLSVSDGKEAVAKAANFLFVKNLKPTKINGVREQLAFTEADVAEALKAIGSGGPNPDLLLIYGPVRCHLGFPAWRMPYTEIVHMGSLKSMRYGSVLRVIYRFTTVRQNYGK